MKGNQIVVYQPQGVTRIDVRFEDETVWLLQSQIAELFSCSNENVRLHLKNIYVSGELEAKATSKEILEVRQEGRSRISERSALRSRNWTRRTLPRSWRRFEDRCVRFSERRRI